MNLNKHNDIYNFKSKESVQHLQSCIQGEKVEEGERKNEAVRDLPMGSQGNWAQDKFLPAENADLAGWCDGLKNVMARLHFDQEHWGTTDNEYAICMFFKRIRYMELYGFKKYPYDLQISMAEIIKHFY